MSTGWFLIYTVGPLMTDFASFGTPEPGLAPMSRHSAFRAAGRHSKRVRFLRRAILLGSIAGVAGVVFFAFFNPFRIAIPSVTIDALGLNGTKVTMDNPKLSGFKGDGRPYTLTARMAVQDARTPSILELHDLDAHVTMGDKSVIHVVSSLGTYDSSKETMTFDKAVHMTNDSGLDAHMAKAYVEFKNGIVDTRDPVTVVMSTSKVSADSMHVGDNGKEVTFEGHVHSVMLPTNEQAVASNPSKGVGP